MTEDKRIAQQYAEGQAHPVQVFPPADSLDMQLRQMRIERDDAVRALSDTRAFNAELIKQRDEVREECKKRIAEAELREALEFLLSENDINAVIAKIARMR